MPSKTTVLCVLLVAAVLLVAVHQRAFACTCLPPESPRDEPEHSTAVFAGKVTGVEVPAGRITSSVDPVRVTFRVQTVWKGPHRNTQTVTTARSSASCGFEFEAGREYLVYAYGREDDLQVSLCSRIKPLALAGADLAALGRGDETGIRSMLQAYKYLIMTAALVVVALGVGVRALLTRQSNA